MKRRDCPSLDAGRGRHGVRAERRARAGLPHPQYPHRGSGRGWRRRRHLRAPDRRQGQDPARRHVHRREPHRRQQHDRRPRRAARRARRLYRAVPRLDPQRRAAGAEERALRSDRRLHADRARRPRAAGAHRRQQPAGKDAGRDRGRGQEGPQGMDVRDRAARRARPSRGGGVQSIRRHQRADHSLSRHGAGR